MNACVWRGVLLGVWLPLASGCVAGSVASSAVNVALNTAIAAGASAASRASGGCYANCPPGTACDSATGMCLRKPCRGECGPNEECVEQTLTYQCVMVTPVGGGLTVQPQKKAKSEP